MTTLKKIATTVIITPAVVGSAGLPPTPARTVVRTETVPIERTVYITGIRNPDGSFTEAPLSEPGAVVIGSYVVREYVTRTVTTYYAASPGVPPTPYQPAVTAVQYALGWDGGARSIEGLAGDGALSFSVPGDAIGAVVGFTPNPNPQYSRSAAAHGLYFRNGFVSVMEAGVEKTGARPFTGADVFKITRAGRTIRYYQGATLIYTSQALSFGQQFAVASLYSGADEVEDATLSAFAPDIPAGGSGGAVLQPLSASGSSSPQATGGAVLQAITADGTGPAIQGGRAQLAPVQATGGRSYAGGAAQLQPFTADGKSIEGAPRFALGTAALALITSYGSGPSPSSVVQPGSSLGDAAAHWTPGAFEGLELVIVSGTGAGQSQTIAVNTEQAILFNGTWDTVPDATSVYEVRDADGNVIARGTVTPADGRMAPVLALGADRPYGGGYTTLEPVRAVGYKFKPVDNYALVTAPRMQLLATATVPEPNGVKAATMPMPQLQAFTGAYARMTAPRMQLQAHAINPIVGEATLTAPRFKLQARMHVGILGEATLTMASGFKLVANTGAYAELKPRNRFRLESAGTTGTLAHAVLTMPLYQLEASVTTGIRARAVLTMPMLQAGNSGRAELVAPRFTLRALASVQTPVEFEAYVMALTGNAVTRYAQFPFHQVVRFRGRHYGIGPDGLFALGGDTDAGSPIPFAVRTAATDFGTRNRKQLNSAYLAGRLGPSTDIAVLEGDEPDQLTRYALPNERGRTAQNHRQKFGKGMRGNYFALEVADADGGPFELDAIEFEVNTLQRKV